MQAVCALCHRLPNACVCHLPAEIERFIAEIDEALLQQVMQESLVTHLHEPCDFTHAPVLGALVRSKRCLFRMQKRTCCLCLRGRRGPQHTRWWECHEPRCRCIAHARCVAKWLCTQVNQDQILVLDRLQCFTCRRATRFLLLNVNEVHL